MINKISYNFAKELNESVNRTDHISGYTHNFYNYPARFSPLFARTVIKIFSRPGDLIFDPFMGGGTTIVEAMVLGRNAVGTDINSLSKFITEVKTTILNEKEQQEILEFMQSLLEELNIRSNVERDIYWIERGYQKNINCRKTWRIRKTIEQIIEQTREKIGLQKQSNFIRGVLLKTSQWAFDTKKEVPRVRDFKDKLYQNTIEMIASIKKLGKSMQSQNSHQYNQNIIQLFNRSVVGIESDKIFHDKNRPNLILTSPPYPGVHVLYHRWQLFGGKETPAPYWIVNSFDGKSENFYTFGGRKKAGIERYFYNAQYSFESISNISRSGTILIQLVGFSRPIEQLPRYLSILESVGFREIKIKYNFPTTNENRIWRTIPNRKWYADIKGNTKSSSEVLLIHIKE